MATLDRIFAGRGLTAAQRRYRRLAALSIGAGGAGGAAPIPIDEWNTDDKEAAIVLTTPYLATLESDSSGDELVRGTYGLITGKRYVEFEVSKPSGFGSDNLGIGLAGAAQSFAQYLGQSTNGIGLWTSGNVYFGDAVAAALAGLAGDAAVTRYAMAVDRDNDLVRFANITRATGLLPEEGIDISSMPAELFLCGDLEKANHSILMVTDPGQYLGEIPPGYTYWRAV